LKEDELEKKNSKIEHLLKRNEYLENKLVEKQNKWTSPHIVGNRRGFQEEKYINENLINKPSGFS
jgi:hypothetical protein